MDEGRCGWPRIRLARLARGGAVNKERTMESRLPASSTVAIVRGVPRYPAAPPYDPARSFAELGALGARLSATSNHAYDGVRRLLARLGLDGEHPGSAWNPLGALVRPGDRVVLKPNWVMHAHPDEETLGAAGFDGLVTHPAVLRALVDYVQLALRGQGRITIADAPLQSCRFDRLLARTHVAELQEHYDRAARSPGAGAAFAPLPLHVVDLRLQTAVPRGGRLGTLGLGYEQQQRADAGRHRIVRLGTDSELDALGDDAERFRVTCYDPEAMLRAHRPGHHEYCIGLDILEADVVINVPKLKTHKKAGLTAALKNLVGINGHKSFLPHHRRGAIADGGDEFLARDPLKSLGGWLSDRAYQERRARWQRVAAMAASSAVAALGRLTRVDGTETGCWYGNDTLWRTCLDLNRILLYADGEGRYLGNDARAVPLRRVLHVVDGIWGGDGDGPLAPRPRASGVLLGGLSAPHVDLAAALLLGFDWRALPLVCRAFSSAAAAPLCDAPAEDLRIRSDVPAWDGFTLAAGRLAQPLDYAAPPGWEAVLRDRQALPIEAARRQPGALQRLGSSPARAHE